MRLPAAIRRESAHRRWAALGFALGALLLLLLLQPPRAAAQVVACRLLRYTFEPDCFLRGADGKCRFDLAHPDLGPQVAVWIESADGGTFVDTLMVTNAVALYGIGNRPGSWDFRSGPRFPYGRRPMALPVWAHRRGVRYTPVVMPDGRDDEIASHQAVSSPEPYFCRPMLPSEVVDAVTCASGNFRSAKGIFDPTATVPAAAASSYYPPRGDLLDWGNICMSLISIDGAGCFDGDARQFGLVDDLDVVATATPLYDHAFAGTWVLPATLADGDYALMVEVSKEFDANASFTHPSFLTPYEQEFYGSYGLDGNVGQPSVVYRVVFHVSGGAAIPDAATDAPVGYGDWTGATGDLTPIDARISGGDGTGSGAARLRRTDGAGGLARVHVASTSCPTVECAAAQPTEVPRMEAPTASQDPAGAVFQFRQSSDQGGPVIEYELRYTPDNQSALDETTFERWTPAPAPGVGPPGTVSSVTLGGLRPSTGYAVGLRARGACGWSNPAFIRLYVGPAKFARLSGCVVATAAYGTELHPDVALLRRERDWIAGRSGLARLGALLYGQSAPALAALIERSDVARTVVRSVLRPVVLVNRGARAALRQP